MSEVPKQPIGAILWRDLTVENAEEVRDFYKKVVGWKSGEIDMGGYSDYTIMQPESGEGIAGVCHKRGTNASIPSQWLMYVQIENLDESLASTEANGGKLLHGPRPMGKNRFAIIQDPAGAVLGLWE